MGASTKIECLENFVLSNPELDKLESLLSDFNIFETLKSEYTEVKHSNVRVATRPAGKSRTCFLFYKAILQVCRFNKQNQVLISRDFFG